MRLHRFYTDNPITDETFDISDTELVSQWRNVFRYTVGGQVILFDGSGTDYHCLITSLRNSGATVSVVRKTKSHFVPKRRVWLCVAVIKKDNFEWVTEKATELGVTDIVPVLCERSEKKNLNMERLRKIASEASEQSGRGDVPTVHEIVDFSEIFERSDIPKEKIVLHPEGEYIGDFLSDKNSKNIAVFIGPEGGFSEAEIKTFASLDIPTISLGSQILRAETAAIAVSSLLLL